MELSNRRINIPQINKCRGRDGQPTGKADCQPARQSEASDESVLQLFNQDMGPQMENCKWKEFYQSADWPFALGLGCPASQPAKQAC
jgi:hypothetical protein